MRTSFLLAMAAAFSATPAFAGTNDADNRPTAPLSSTQTQPVGQETQPPTSTAQKRDDQKKGLSRKPDDCNKGCIGGNPP